MSSKKPVVVYSENMPNPLSRVAIDVAKQKEIFMRQQTPEDYRKNQRQLSSIRPVHPLLFSIEQEVIMEVPCEWISARMSKPSNNIIYYLHGGSWMFGDLDSARPVGEMLARETGYKVLVIDYNKAPEKRYPHGFNDCLNIYKEIVMRGYSIGVFGDSAGGNYSLALLNQLKLDRIHLPTCVGLASPVTNMQDSSHLVSRNEDLTYMQYEGREHSIFSLYLGDKYYDSRQLPTISPITADLRGLPPMLIHAGESEAIAEDSIEYAKKAYDSGVDIQVKIWREMFHDFTVVGATLAESRASMKEFGEFFVRHMEKKDLKIINTI